MACANKGEGMTGSRRGSILRFPTTWLGKVALSFAAAFLVFLVLMAMLAAAGQLGGERQIDHFWLAIMGALALGTGMAAGVTALLAAVRHGERSVLVFMVIALGAMVTLLAIGVIATPP